MYQNVYVCPLQNFLCFILGEDDLNGVIICQKLNPNTYYSSTSRLEAHPMIFKLFIQGKIGALFLEKLIFAIVATVRNYTVIVSLPFYDL